MNRESSEYNAKLALALSSRVRGRRQPALSSVRKVNEVNYLSPALKAGLIEMTDPDSPKSPKQRYRNKKTI
ncbi:Fic family protein [Prevotella sp. E13-27]|uniref:Fic family protein n=1 Tax=Prevotella sp. E13-27 TaxID=2938122 RepID=UPI00397B2F50